MKYRELMIGLGAVAFAAAVACPGTAQTATAPPGANPPPGTMHDPVGGPLTQDATFVRQVQAGNDDEIGQARYMLTVSKDPAVRTFANEMISDHSTANVQLQRAARSASIPLPQRGRKMHGMMAPTALRGMTGPDLDRAYFEGQVTGHEKMLALVQGEEKSGTDPGLKAYASALEPTVQKHLDAAKNVVSLGTKAGGAMMRDGTTSPATAPNTAPSPSTSAPGGLTPNAPSPPSAAPSPASSGQPTPVGSTPPVPAAPPTKSP